MVVVFLVTGFMGYVFATSYDETISLVLPIGLDFGWNLTNHNIFSNGPNGAMILQVNRQPELPNVCQLISFGIYIIVTVIALLYVKSKYITEQKYVGQ